MRFTIFCCGLVLAAALLTPGEAASPQIRQVAVNESFDDVKFTVEDAIIKRGLVIDYTAHIGEMLDRTAKDVGASRKVYGQAQAVQFCSAVLSRRTIEADPANIGFCPYVIFMYTLEGRPATTFVGYRELHVSGSAAERDAITAVNVLLDGIVRAASGKK